MKKYLITGASGFIGFRLARSLSEQGNEVIAVIRDGNSQEFSLKQLHNTIVYKSNMEDYYKLHESFGDVDCLIHMAWAGVRGKDRFDSLLQEKNYIISTRLIDGFVNEGIKKIVLAGSQAEYGIFNTIITESMDCSPNSEYGVYKLKLYNYVKRICAEREISYIEPRFFSLYGPGDNPETMIISVLKKMLNNEICRLTECIQKWDFLYIDDAINALVQLCTKDCQNGAYNFGSGDCRVLKSFIEEMKSITNSKSELLFGAVPYTAAGLVSIQPDISRLKNEIGWQPATSFAEGIKRVIATL